MNPVGLDAVVYRNKRHLQLGLDEKAAKLIPETGEIYFDDNEVSRKHREQLQAASIRFGNIFEVAELRDELTGLIGSNSLLCSKGTYSGSHSGDFVPMGELRPLSDEIALARHAGRISKELSDFLDRVEQLICAAENEGNPIVFV